MISSNSGKYSINEYLNDTKKFDFLQGTKEPVFK